MRQESERKLFCKGNKEPLASFVAGRRRGREREEGGEEWEGEKREQSDTCILMPFLDFSPEQVLAHFSVKC